jgi:hypothetical protein
MVDLTQPTPALTQLLSAKTSLDQYIAYLDQAMLELRVCDAADGLTQLTNAQAALQTYQSQIQAAQTALQPYQNVLFSGSTAITPTNATLQQKQDALTQFDIPLTVISGSLGSDPGWNRGSSERVSEAYRAVYNIIFRIAEKVFSNDMLLGALQFRRTFGGTELQLAGQRQSGTTPYAETLNPGGATIFLYIQPTTPPPLRADDITRGWVVHTAENIIHEFGHVLVFRNGSDNSALYKQWYVSWNDSTDLGIGQYISIPFGPTEGWGGNAGNLQNTEVLTGSELENERIANMFEAWSTGYIPEINSSDERQQRAAWALWTFMTGTPAPYNPQYPDDRTKTVWIDGSKNVRPIGSGIQHWIQLYGNP